MRLFGCRLAYSQRQGDRLTGVLARHSCVERLICYLDRKSWRYFLRLLLDALYRERSLASDHTHETADRASVLKAARVDLPRFGGQ